MPRKTGMTPIHVLVSEENRERVKQLAERRGYKITADYIRGLIEADARAHGVELDLSVDRGGDRQERD